MLEGSRVGRGGEDGGLGEREGHSPGTARRLKWWGLQQSAAASPQPPRPPALWQ